VKIVPDSLVKRVYVKGSLKSVQNGFAFELDNELRSLTLTKVLPLEVDGRPWPVAGLSFVAGNDKQSQKADGISKRKPWPVPAGRVEVRVQGMIIDRGPHDVRLPVEAKRLGRLNVTFSDAMKDLLAAPPGPGLKER